MITNKKKLKRIIKMEKKYYFDSRKDFIKSFLTSNERYKIWCFQKNLRCAEYHFNRHNFIHKIYYFCRIKKKNKLGIKLGIHMMINTIDEGLHIYHCGNIVISGLAKIGKNLKLHGSNCIGNNGKSESVPTLGNNVDLGFGSIVIGNVFLGDNCIVGANSVVLKSFPSDSRIVGIPGVLK